MVTGTPDTPVPRAGICYDGMAPLPFPRPSAPSAPSALGPLESGRLARRVLNSTRHSAGTRGLCAVQPAHSTTRDGSDERDERHQRKRSAGVRQATGQASQADRHGFESLRQWPVASGDAARELRECAHSRVHVPRPTAYGAYAPTAYGRTKPRPKCASGTAWLVRLDRLAKAALAAGSARAWGLGAERSASSVRELGWASARCPRVPAVDGPAMPASAPAAPPGSWELEECAAWLPRFGWPSSKGTRGRGKGRGRGRLFSRAQGTRDDWLRWLTSARQRSAVTCYLAAVNRADAACSYVCLRLLFAGRRSWHALRFSCPLAPAVPVLPRQPPHEST